jgi:FAD/FMN-containing dehydrogenase/Fe-S oxidoreductase
MNATRASRLSKWDGDALALARKLKHSIRGEVRFDSGSRALYATDASNYRQVPIGVVIPREVEDVVRTIALCREFGAPILSRGGGTSLAGQCCNVAVVMDHSKYLREIVELNIENKFARVQPGIVLDVLRHAAEKHSLTFGPDPATHDHCTVGGMIGNNSCGVHSVMAGRTADNIEELEILTYDGLRMRVGRTSESELQQIIRAGGRRGEIYSRLKNLRDKYADLIRARYPKIPRRVSGYNLDELLPENGFHVARALVGSEGTCVTVLEAKCRLVHHASHRSLLVLGYEDVYHAADHVMEVLAHKPQGLEGIDDVLIADMKKKGIHPHEVRLLPEGNGWLIIEFGGESRGESDAKARGLMVELKRKPDCPTMKLFDDPREEKIVWEIRESGLGATAHVIDGRIAWEGWEDSAVPPQNVGRYLRDLRRLYNRYDYRCSLYGHFGDGCIHTRIDFDLQTASGIKKYQSFVREAAELVVSYGGSISGEHGDGQSKAVLLPIMFGPDLVNAFREFKSIWDPKWKMNPGKVVDPYTNAENLRLGADYDPWQPETNFKYPTDGGNFSQVTLRCVGVGKCRRAEGGTMCPSYMVTREEKHSTRGRAHLFFEMLQGEVIRDGWRSKEVLDALDLCLSCKGCKADCPVNVDMATYKAEFLSHYYKGRLRPRAAYSMGLIYWWARLASKMPRLANYFTHAPVFASIGKFLAGVAPEREMPPFATQPFKTWFAGHAPRNPNGTRVILWADTFNNYFHPHVAQAVVEVLEDAGMNVIVPQQSLCCGRPLYDYGMLDTAKKLLRQILNALRDDIRAGTPLIGIEPSCLAVFRDELIEMFPHDEDAKRLHRQSFTLAEFLMKQMDGYEPPKLKQRAVLHGHCHHKAIMKLSAEKELLEQMGLDVHELDSGCCGMAGSFGFEREKYDVSVKCGERALLPAVRDANHDTLIIADGFSCKEQISQLTTRKALHIAEVMQLALRAGGRSKSSGKLKPFLLKPKEQQEADARLASVGKIHGDDHNGKGNFLRRALKAVVVGTGLATVAGAIYERTTKRH